MSWFYDYYDAPSVSELIRMAQENLSKNNRYSPVILNNSSRFSKNICNSWWGNAWCKNLERYADCNNRIDRGKSYLKNNMVIDLKINGGEIYAKVQGSRKTPYTVKITIDPIDEKKRLRIEEQATGKIQNLEALINGTFPEELKDIFFQNDGLFPSLKEIHFNCSCPDFARMCKHVSAALFGVGIRLDKNPIYFFQMRGINIDDFVNKAVFGKVNKMLENTDVITTRIIQESDITKLFGI